MIYSGKAETLAALSVVAAARKYLHWHRPALASGTWGCVRWRGPCGTEDGRRPAGRPKGCFYHSTSPRTQNQTSLLCSSALRRAWFSFTSPLARISGCVLSAGWFLCRVLSAVSPLQVYAWCPFPSSTCLPLVYTLLTILLTTSVFTLLAALDQRSPTFFAPRTGLLSESTFRSQPLRCGG